MCLLIISVEYTLNYLVPAHANNKKNMQPRVCILYISSPRSYTHANWFPRCCTLHAHCRLFHPAGNPVPLDVIAGVRGHGTCLTKEGPVVAIYLQVDPRDHDQFVNVIVLEEYLSREWMGEWEGEVDKMRFQRMKGKKYLRVSTDMGLFGTRDEESEVDTALMTFGRGGTLSAYETDPDMSPYEQGILTMTAKVHAVVDEVVRWAIGKLRDGSDVKPPHEGRGGQKRNGRKKQMKGKKRKGNQEPTRMPKTRTRTRRGATKSASRSLAGDTVVCAAPPVVGLQDLDLSGVVHRGEEAFEYPVAGIGKLPLDSPDAVASHVSLNSPYDHHSDTANKPCNHNNEWRWSHETQMRILTHCMVRSSEGSNRAVPERVVSIR